MAASRTYISKHGTGRAIREQIRNPGVYGYGVSMDTDKGYNPGVYG